MKYTTEQVLALAPDNASVTAARKLTTPAKWPLLGCSDEACWGHCQGSGKKPYETSIDLREPAFKCSCPSRKFPCKHSLALFLLYADGAVNKTAAPDWVLEWLEQRQKREENRAARASQKAARETDPQTRAKTQAKRINSIKTGLADCEIWLRDLALHGFSTVRGSGYEMWDTAAARLVDAKAPGAAGLIQRMGAAAAGGAKDWLEELTLLTGRLFSLIRAFQRYEDLPEACQADIRTAVGWPLEKDEVLALGRTQSGTWTITGQSIRDARNLREQRVWLREIETGTPALILNFQYGQQPLDVSMIPGAMLEAELAFYPGSRPMRALVKQRTGELKNTGRVNGSAGIEQALSAYAEAAGQNPWLTLWPFVISDLTPCLDGDCLRLRDNEGRSVQIHRGFKDMWELLALSGGRGLTVAGEWERQTLLPLSCWNKDGFHRFDAELAV